MSLAETITEIEGLVQTIHLAHQQRGPAYDGRWNLRLEAHKYKWCLIFPEGRIFVSDENINHLLQQLKGIRKYLMEEYDV